ncbi:hypothetical protein ASC74_07520 [Pseudomonas sp. Root329]|uniref:hypothetical protein n=1 Tax=Pseudomonas sp. Root329 TaxID=1736515 RepID=UPI0006FCCE6B|nr:hypothetical protein [Pseudomonas sp. Root329]KQV12949.1 hypothetical protein ASC74_07520 [Pseudomonas sp. Root329]
MKQLEGTDLFSIRKIDPSPLLVPFSIFSSPFFSVLCDLLDLGEQMNMQIAAHVDGSGLALTTFAALNIVAIGAKSLGAKPKVITLVT